MLNNKSNVQSKVPASSGAAKPVPVTACVGCSRGYPRLIECAKCCAAWLKFDIPEDCVKKGFARIKDWAATAMGAEECEKFEAQVRKSWAAM